MELTLQDLMNEIKQLKVDIDVIKEDISNDKLIPTLSDDEQKELEGLHGNSLDNPIIEKDFEPL